jgi:hypothetical protein
MAGTSPAMTKSLNKPDGDGILWNRLVPHRAGLSAVTSRCFALSTDYRIARPTLFAGHARREAQVLRDIASNDEETTMRTTILTILAASLMAASTVQLAAAAEHHHHARKIDRAAASEQFRHANNAIPAPAQPDWYSNYSDYSTSHMNMVGH